MKTQRCPMCGVDNPQDLDVCQSCDARLKPLIGHSPEDQNRIKPGEDPTQKKTSELESPAYMRAAEKNRSVTPGEEPLKKKTSELESALPGWLRQVRNTENDQVEETQPEQSQDEAPIPASAEAPATPVSNLPDWLSGLVDEATSADAQQEDDTPDWLAGLRGVETPTSPSKPPAEPTKDDDTSWLKNIQADSQPEPTPAESETFEMASDFDSGSPDPSPDTVQDDQWLAENDIPDWLSSTQAEGSSTNLPAADSISDDEFSSWLSNIDDNQPTDSQQPVSESDPHDEGDMPDWLSNMSKDFGIEQPPSPATSPQQAKATFDVEDTPDWLAGMSDAAIELPTDKTTPVEDAAIFTDHEDLPDWLRSADEDAPAEESADGLPDWLADDDKHAPEFSKEPPKIVAFKDFEETAFSDEEEIPDWLAETIASQSPATDMPELEQSDDLTAAFDFSESDTEAEVRVPSQETAPAVEETLDDDLFAGDMPDWLSGMQPEETAEKSQATAKKAEGTVAADDLSPVDLPNWVQAMRPVESALADTGPLSADPDGSDVEKSGPLAGLAGILPAAPAGFLAGKLSSTQGTRLQVTENQKNHMAVLESLLAAESEARQIRKEIPTAPARVLRWIVAALLFLVVFAIAISGVQITPLPTYASNEMWTAINHINALDGESPALIVFDHQPATAGEMRTVVSPVLDHMMLKGIPFTMLSTTPMGPILAENALDSVKGQHDYRAVNLGYLPGGVTGIRRFVSNPSATILMQVDGVSVWDLPVLAAVRSYTDFALVVVVTDSAETGREWLEQTAEYRGLVPFIYVTSAQAEPMMRPYIASGQIEGIVSGIVSSISYEQAMGNQSRARKYWDAYSAGLLLAVLLIGFGTIVSLFDAWRARINKERDEA